MTIFEDVALDHATLLLGPDLPVDVFRARVSFVRDIWTIVKHFPTVSKVQGTGNRHPSTCTHVIQHIPVEVGTQATKFALSTTKGIVIKKNNNK